MPAAANHQAIRPDQLAWLIWLFTVATTAMVAWSTPTEGDVSLQAHELGLIFTAYALGARAIACALHDWGTFVMATLGITFGLWFPYLTQQGGPQMLSIIALTGITDPLLARLELPAVIAAAGMMTAAGTYLVTHSGRCFFEMVTISIVCGLALVIPVEQPTFARIAVLMWHTCVCASLCRWALVAARRAQGVGCPFCGSDLLGLTTPVCPSCKHALPNACRLPGSSRRAA